MQVLQTTEADDVLKASAELRTALDYEGRIHKTYITNFSRARITLAGIVLLLLSFGAGALVCTSAASVFLLLGMILDAVETRLQNQCWSRRYAAEKNYFSKNQIMMQKNSDCLLELIGTVELANVKTNGEPQDRSTIN
jgi:hypothetical protein